MRVNTSDLTEPALDYFVALCEGHECEFVRDIQSQEPRWFPWLRMNKATRKINEPLARTLSSYRPSSVWAVGGQIIERAKIGTHYTVGDFWYARNDDGDPDLCVVGRGPTPLIAAMRCYVASKLGDEVVIPEELL